MNRRRLLTALAGLGLTGGSLWVAQNGLPSGTDAGPASGSGSESGKGNDGSSASKNGSDGSGDGSDATSGESHSLPLRVETMDARGSEAGHVHVPKENVPTLVDLFATWCPSCKKQMPTLAAVHEEYGDRVAFVSVTNERVGATLTRDDIREWWRNNDGNWTVGLDPESDLMSAVGASGLPYLVLTDASGTVQWTHAGAVEEAVLRRRIEEVVDS